MLCAAPVGSAHPACRALAPSLEARNGERSLSQHIRDRWGTESGFPGGPVYAITQTADGYLWIGAEKGLVRFDGLTFVCSIRSEVGAGPAVLGVAGALMKPVGAAQRDRSGRYHTG